MGMVTIIHCDCGCRRSIEIGDTHVKGAEEMLQVTDAMGKKIFLISTECFLKWASTYECPYSKENMKVDETEAFEGLLPGDGD
jgi:hypothetical protein